MNTLHLHDNVHHIRGLTPRAESDRSGALTSPSSFASPGDVQQFQPQIDGTVTIEGPEYTGPETSRTNTPAPVTEEQVSTSFFFFFWGGGCHDCLRAWFESTELTY